MCVELAAKVFTYLSEKLYTCRKTILMLSVSSNIPNSYSQPRRHFDDPFDREAVPRGQSKLDYRLCNVWNYLSTALCDSHDVSYIGAIRILCCFYIPWQRKREKSVHKSATSDSRRENALSRNTGGQHFAFDDAAESESRANQWKLAAARNVVTQGFEVRWVSRGLDFLAVTRFAIWEYVIAKFDHTRSERFL